METIEDSKTALETEAPGAATEAEATPSRTLGPSARRSLERAAVRDLKARKRSDYRQQNQADTARIDQLRRQRNEQVERIDRQIHELRAAYGVSASEHRVPWIDALDEAAVARRAARRALTETRRAENPADRAAIEALRVAHRAAQDGFAEEQHELTLAHELALSDLREDLNDARGRKGEAKRAMRADLREMRRANAAEKDARTAAETHARQERTAASEARWEAARKANLDYAVSVVELRDAERAKEPRARIEELRTKKDLMRARAEELETVARTTDLAVSDALFEQQWASAAEAAFAKAQAKDPWLGGKHDAVVEKRKAREAIRAYKAQTRAAKEAAEGDLRHRRNAEAESYAEAVNAVYATRGQREAELKGDYLGKQDDARKIRKQAKAAARAYAREAKGAYHEALEALRKEKVRVEEEFAQAVNEINRTRGMERAEERAQVRDIADEILDTYEKAERPGTPRV